MYYADLLGCAVPFAFHIPTSILEIEISGGRIKHDNRIETVHSRILFINK